MGTVANRVVLWIDMYRVEGLAVKEMDTDPVIAHHPLAPTETGTTTDIVIGRDPLVTTAPTDIVDRVRDATRATIFLYLVDSPAMSLMCRSLCSINLTVISFRG